MKTLNIYQKLHKIQAHIIGLGKDKAATSYRYVTGDKVLEHIKPLMNELGLILKQEVLSIENQRQDYRVGISDQKPDGRPKSEIHSKVMMRFTWVDIETGDKDENLFGANGQNDWDKGVGSALTYGERYFLLKFFHIATDEDDIDNPDRKKEDAPTTQGNPIQPQPKATPTPTPAVKWLNPNTAQWNNAVDKKVSIDEVKKHYSISKTNEDLYLKAIN